MTSLVAIFLLTILPLGSVAFLVATHFARERPAARLATLTPARLALFAVFAVYVVARTLSVLLAND